MSILRRNCLNSLSYLLEKFPCVAIIGPRQAGKSTLLRELLPESPFFDLETIEHFDRINSDPDFFLSQYDNPIVIDEAQLLPKLFPALRVAIDRKRKENGRFLISGSSSPELLSSITESLAGRIAIFELSPFSIHESWQVPLSDFPKRLGLKKFELPTSARLTQEQIDQSFLYGGYPDAFLGREDPKYFDNWMKNYFLTYINRDIRKLFPKLNFGIFQKFISMLSDSSGELINYSNYAKSLDVSQPTIKSYFQIASGSFFWRSLGSYERKTLKRITKMPKGHIFDSGIMNYLSRVKSIESLYNHPSVGRKWEAFVIEQILRIFNDDLIQIKSSHYRTHNQVEIDLILEGDFGIVPIEIKLGKQAASKQLDSLRSYVKENKLPYGIVINNSEEACWLSENIAQIPFKNL